MVAAAAANKEIAQALVTEVERAQSIDHTRALLAMAVLGEMKSTVGEAYFREFAFRPLPETGTVIEGEIIEQTRQAMLQGKAADGLGYINSETSNAALLEIIAKHPSKIVRAEAINAYLWNHGDSADARDFLARRLRADDRILVDRVRRVSGETAASFNPKVVAFLKAHPEAVAPPPEKLPASAQPRVEPPKGFDAKPPPF
jgi:HEAT repeat protein